MTQLRHAIGILHETKNRWERRVPLIPEEVAPAYVFFASEADSIVTR